MVATHTKPAEKESEPTNHCFSNIGSILSEIWVLSGKFNRYYLSSYGEKPLLFSLPISRCMAYVCISECAFHRITNTFYSLAKNRTRYLNFLSTKSDRSLTSSVLSSTAFSSLCRNCNSVVAAEKNDSWAFWNWMIRSNMARSCVSIF